MKLWNEQFCTKMVVFHKSQRYKDSILHFGVVAKVIGTWLLVLICTELGQPNNQILGENQLCNMLIITHIF